MKFYAVINPSAGQRRTDEQTKQSTRLAESFGADIAVTRGPGDAERLAQSAAKTEKYDAIIACGGDGTINEIVNGIMSVPRTSRPALGILPTGTCNVLASELGVPSDESAAGIIAVGKRRAIDIGRAGKRFFLMMASYGFDADAVRRVEPKFKGLVGAPAYVFSGIAALAQYKPSRVRVTLDETELNSDAFLIVVANISSYAWESLKVAPFASLDDGWLDVCIFERPPGNTIGFMGQMLLTMARKHLRDPRVRYYRARKIRIESEPPIHGQVDGDLSAPTPVNVTIAPRALEVFVP
jgi:diacylglycerol kinase (ATP)